MATDKKQRWLQVRLNEKESAKLEKDVLESGYKEKTLYVKSKLKLIKIK